MLASINIEESIHRKENKKISVNAELVLALEKSEKINKVYKQNAGAAQENVKHPKELLMKLNKAVIPEYADLLISLHENSEISN